MYALRRTLKGCVCEAEAAELTTWRLCGMGEDPGPPEGPPEVRIANVAA